MNHTFGAHNAATGCPSLNFLHALLVPFARCQCFDLQSIAVCGCRLFDLRVRRHHGILHIAHGLWMSSTPLSCALYILAKFRPDALVDITYEGHLDTQPERDGFISEVLGKVSYFNRSCAASLRVVNINVKRPTWTVLATCNAQPYHKAFHEIRGWRTLLPFPLLWHIVRLLSGTSDKSDNEQSIPLYDFV